MKPSQGDNHAHTAFLSNSRQPICTMVMDSCRNIDMTKQGQFQQLKGYDCDGGIALCLASIWSKMQAVFSK